MSLLLTSQNYKPRKSEYQGREVGSERKKRQEKEEDRPSKGCGRALVRKEREGRMLIVRLRPTFPIPILSSHSVLCCWWLPRTSDLGPGLWTLEDQVRWTLDLGPWTSFQGAELTVNAGRPLVVKSSGSLRHC